MSSYNNFKLDYDYTEVAPNCSQYDDVDLENTIGVDARYVKSETNPGNMYIEALPPPKEGEGIEIKCTIPLSSYTTREEEIEKPFYIQLLKIRQLRKVRFILPMNRELEEECYCALVDSYSLRKTISDKDVAIEYVAHNKTEITNSLTSGKGDDEPISGFALIGYSGCGKSSSLGTLFKTYPQYINHRGPGIRKTPQIVYLVVQCPPNSNFRGLYINIGKALDKALGNIKPVYEKELDPGPHGNLSLYRSKVEDLINKFAIGLIVFDEIQHVHFTSQTENSFETLLEICNSTQVAIAVVGTEDAKRKIFNSTMKQARRIGVEIRADRYCNRRALFDSYARKLMDYQWFDVDIKADCINVAQITDALYECSKGIIDQLVGLYMYMNIDYIRAPNGSKPIVNKDYVYAVSEKHYAGMRAILENALKKEEIERIRIAVKKKADEELDELIAEEKSNAALNETVSRMQNDSGVVDEMKKEVVRNILSCGMFDESSIYSNINIVMTSEEGKKLVLQHDSAALTRQTMELLMSKYATVSKPRKKKKIKEELPASSLEDYVFGDEDEADDLL